MKSIQIENIHRCPLCGYEKLEFSGPLQYGKNQVYSGLKIETHFTPGLFKCKGCHSSFVSPRLEINASKKLYNESPATRWINKGDISEFSLDILFKKYTPDGFKKIFLKYFKQGNGKRVLDVGCFQGKLLDIFKAHGYETYGVDLNSEATKKKLSRHNVLCGEIKDAKKFNVKFDLITAFDLVEHLYNTEEFWKNIVALLNENGMAVILTGNPNSIGAQVFKNKWWYFKYPEHIVFPSRRYYKALKKRYGLSIKKIFKVYHRAAYTTTTVYKLKMYGLLLISFLRQALSDFSTSALSVPSLSKDHFLILFKK